MNEKDTKETSVENVQKEEIEIDNINQNNLEQVEVKENKKEKKIVGKVLGMLGKTLAWSIIIFLVIILIRALAFKKYDVFGYRFYLIMSGSMEPTIHVSDAVITKEIDNPQDGDIIAFQYGSSITVHRITKTYTQETVSNALNPVVDDNNKTVEQDKIANEFSSNYADLSLKKLANDISFDLEMDARDVNYDLAVLGSKKVTFEVAKVTIQTPVAFNYSNCMLAEFQTDNRCILPNFTGNNISSFNSWYQNFGYIQVNKVAVSDSAKTNDTVISQNPTNKSIYEIFTNNEVIKIEYVKNEEAPPKQEEKPEVVPEPTPEEEPPSEPTNTETE